MKLTNTKDETRCLERKRHDGYLHNGILRETARTCSNTGAELVRKVRAQF